MPATSTGPAGTAPDSGRVPGLGRFGARAGLGLLAVVAGAIPFLLLWLLVERRWSPLAGLDSTVAAALNETVAASPRAVDVLRHVTDLGGTGFAILVFVLTTAFLAIRGHVRLAAFVTVTGLGMAVLGPLTKAVVDRARPVVESPVVEPPSNASFPSGHAMTSLVTWGVLLLLVLPAVRRGARPWLVGGAAVVVVAVGFSRLALGVHFVSDVLAGWALGVLWLASTTVAFRTWQHELRPRSHEDYDPLEVPADGAPRLAERPEALGRRTVGRLAAAAALLWLCLTGLGLLIVENTTWLGRLDRALLEAVVEQRSGTLTSVATVVGSLAGTRAVAAVALGAAVLGSAFSGSRRPVILLATAVVGEVLIYAAVSQTVGRLRPDVADLTSGLPGGASWPSGHTAAAVTLYGAVAALVVLGSRSRWRWAVLALPLFLAPAVGLSRVYVAAHYPSDVVGGLLLGAAWLAVCVRATLPDGLPRRHARNTPGTRRTAAAGVN